MNFQSLIDCSWCKLSKSADYSSILLIDSLEYYFMDYNWKLKGITFIIFEITIKAYHQLNMWFDSALDFIWQLLNLK